jgi:two-component system aerobic respiration control sensor histidine kinase ArcB
MPKKNLINPQASLIPELRKQIKQLEAKISVYEAESFRYKNLIDNLPGDIYWKNKDGVWMGMNKRCARSLNRMGYIKTIDESEIIGKSDYEVFDIKSADGYRQNDCEVMQNKMEITREEIAYLPTGEKITLLSTKTPLWDINGNIAGIVGNTIDM